MAEYWDREGLPIGQDEWLARWSDIDYKVVEQTMVGMVQVSTVWLGLDHGMGGGAPLIFETMIFGGELDQTQWRYPREVDALKGHEKVVRLVEVVAEQ